MTDKFGYFLTIVNVKEIPKAEINPYEAPRITEPSGAFSAVSDPLTAKEMPHTAKININHEIRFCCSFKKKTDNKAVKRGIVASAVKTTMTEVSLSQSVERLNRQSCESSKRKSEYFDDAHYDEDGCEIEDK